jgi:acyl carrier protein
MSNYEKYVQAFVRALNISEEEVTSATYKEGDWDSVGHMILIGEIEDAYGIELDTDDIININSFEEGKNILKKYDIEM